MTAPDDQHARRRREVFGEVLPESTLDDRDDETAQEPGENEREAWLRANVPPHHG